MATAASSSLARFSENWLDPNPGDPPGMTDVSGHEFEPVVDGGRGDLEIGVGKPAPFFRQSRLDLSVDARDRDIVRKDSHCQQYPRIDVLKMPLAII